VTTTRVRVRYAETDAQGVAYHAHYLVWMEIGRTRLLEQLGFPYPRLEREGVLFSVVEARCRYLGAARYDDEVEVETRVSRARSRTVAFDYRMRIGESVVATGETTLVALDRERAPRRVPPDLARALAEAAGD